MELAKITPNEILQSPQLQRTFSKPQLEIVKISVKKTIRSYDSSSEFFTVPEYPNGLTGNEYARYRIGQVLELCYKMVGLPRDKFPLMEEAKLISLNVQKYHSDLSIEDLLFAFELAVNNVININVEHYHTVGVKYINSILREYKIYKHKITQQVNEKIIYHSTNHLQEYLKSIKRDYFALIDLIVLHYDNFIENENIEGNYMLPKAYDLLKEVGLMTLSEDERKEAKQRATTSIKVDKAFDIQHASNDGIVPRAKVLCVFMIFKKLKEEGITIKELKELISVTCLIPSNHFENIKKYKN